MNQAEGKVCMAKLARIDHELAELDAQRATLGAKRAAVWAELAEGEVVDIRTLRKHKTQHRPVIPPSSDEDRAQARSYLQQSDLNRAIKYGQK